MKRKFICNNCDNGLIVLVFFFYYNYWFQHVVMCDCKLFGFFNSWQNRDMTLGYCNECFPLFPDIGLKVIVRQSAKGRPPKVI